MSTKTYSVIPNFKGFKDITLDKLAKHDVIGIDTAMQYANYFEEQGLEVEVIAVVKDTIYKTKSK
ncbi:hypothetical protein [Hafnia phage Pocis76]|uniref:Uncharacterized protein n=1 Tax=Hafnia phage Pocis76 TaxID=2831174 RepID=A0A8E7KY07_9CAUD|nr:hypothetical protein [Hafnia phage Pocis76]